MFDIKSAIKDALSDFDRFKQEMERTSDPASLDPELVRSVQTITKQACQALGLLNTFGASFAISPDIKAHMSQILDYFLNDPSGAQKLALLSSAKDWDFAKHFLKLDKVLKSLP